MSLSPSQLATLKAAIVAETDPIIVAAREAGDTPTIARWYNDPATPAALVWAINVERRTLDEAANYASFDSVIAGKRDAWRIFLDGTPRDMRRAKNRNVIVDVWGSGTIARAILTAGTRDMTRAEKLIGGGSVKTTDTIAATDLDWTGPLSPGDVVDALAA